MTIKETGTLDKINADAFYKVWEGMVNDLSDADLDEHIEMVLDEKRYMTAMDEENV